MQLKYFFYDNKTMKTEQVESINMAKQLSTMFDTIIPLSKESFRLTKEQKEKFKKIKCVERNSGIITILVRGILLLKFGL